MSFVRDIQQQTAEILNGSELLTKTGVKALAEDTLDVDFRIREAVLKQGLSLVVMTPSATYIGSYEGRAAAWQCRLEIDVVENAPVWRAWLKKKGLGEGTALDLGSYCLAILGSPRSQYYGEYCPVSIEQGEDNGLIVVRVFLDVKVRAEDDKVLTGWTFTDGKKHTMELVHDGSWYWEADGGVGDLWHVEGQEYETEQEAEQALEVKFEDRSSGLPGVYVYARRRWVIR